MGRISKDEYYWSIAKQVAQRGTCLSTRIGAVIVNNDQIVSTGYVGAPRGTKSCDERGECLRRTYNIPSGTQYEACASVHAEQNAIINAARAGVSILGGTMYLYAERLYGGSKLINALPCFICKKMIVNAGLKRFVGNDSEGSIKSFEIENWIEEWKHKHLLEDNERFQGSYEKKQEKDKSKENK